MQLLTRLCLISLSFPVTSAIIFNANVSSNGLYTIDVNHFWWLRSAPTYFIVGGKRHSLSDGSLYSNTTYTGNNIDELGYYHYDKFRYYAGKTIIDCSINNYDSGNFIVFEQKFVSGVQNSRPPSCSDTHECYQQTTGAFPSFFVEEAQISDLGYSNFGGSMLNLEPKIGRWSKATTKLNGGMLGGPIAIFNSMGNTVLISPLDNFMSSSFWHEDEPGGRVNWGIMGGVMSVPFNYRQRTILVAGNSISQAFEAFSEAMRKVYGTSEKKKYFRQNDITLKYLGYWTDNGAYYYYNPERNKTYDQTTKDIFNYAEKEKMPYRYIQLDSWWYYKGYRDGVKQWTARPDVFPNGIGSVQQYTKWPLAAHNRYWAIDNVYAKQNGGKYTFEMAPTSPLVAVPNDKMFWYDLMKNATKWGLKMYEQDWLNQETLDSTDLNENLYLGETW